jgi:hypothetical protein
MIVKVLKSDGSIEDFLYTKVLYCVSSALSAAHEWDVSVAQRLAEAVTAFVYCQQQEQVRSRDILAMVGVVLQETGYTDAAAALGEHHRRRSLSRGRTELIEAEIRHLDDAHAITDGAMSVQQWSKCRVVEHVAAAYGLDRQAARAVAGRVEEKVLAMGIARIWSGLLSQIVMAETAMTIRAEEHLRQATRDRREAAVPHEVGI